MITQPITINKETLIICIDREIAKYKKKVEESEKTIWKLREDIQTLPVKMKAVYYRDWWTLWWPRMGHSYDTNAWQRGDKQEEIKQMEIYITDQVEEIATLNSLKERTKAEKSRTPIPVFSNEIVALGDSFPLLLAFQSVNN